MTYLLMALDANGQVRWAQTTTPEVPEGWVRPGEVGFVIEPLDIVARHTHEIGTERVRR